MTVRPIYYNIPVSLVLKWNAVQKEENVYVWLLFYLNKFMYIVSILTHIFHGNIIIRI